MDYFSSSCMKRYSRCVRFDQLGFQFHFSFISDGGLLVTNNIPWLLITLWRR